MLRRDGRRLREKTDMSTTVWIVLGILFLLLLGGSSSKGKKSSGSRGEPTRIDRMHYYDPDDHECSVCGARFEGKSMVCPKCGTRFKGTKEDDDEFIEEMVFWEDDDD